MDITQINSRLAILRAERAALPLRSRLLHTVAIMRAEGLLRLHRTRWCRALWQEGVKRGGYGSERIVCCRGQSTGEVFYMLQTDEGEFIEGARWDHPLGQKLRRRMLELERKDRVALAN